MDSQLAGESEVKTAANKGNKPLIILTSILGFVFVLGIVGIISYTAAKSDDGIKAISQGKTSVSKDVVNNGVTTGTISGNLSYPSETVVPMEICAYQSNPDKTYCTSFAGSEIDPSDSYKIELPSGEYYVYADAGDSTQSDIAFYTKCDADEVVSGEAQCENFEPIKVTVSNGNDTNNINFLNGWYVPVDENTKVIDINYWQQFMK